MKHTPDQVYYEIKRETSKYNKYMKWHLLLYREDKTLLSSMYHKTRKAAERDVDNSILRGKEGFPIGNRLYFTEYLPITKAEAE